MALAIGDIVSPHLDATSVNPQPQPPSFGIIDDTSSGYDVLWEDGKTSNVVTANSLDKIEAASGDNVSGQRVFVNLSPGSSFQPSSDYQGVVLAVYKRDQGDSGSPTADLALVKLISSGAYLEVLRSQCTPVAGGA